ncbi:hypothetical protein HETIRDRAFT_389594, partial [Heterobasidion irregulare TC 32-1]
MSKLTSPGTYTPTILQGKLALITGATGGIGQATTRLLASRGVSIAVHYFSSQAKADALVSEILANNPSIKAAAFQADLGDYDAVRRMHKQIVETLGSPDILYCNAAATGTIVGIKGKIQDVTVEEFEKVWRSNTASAFLLSQLCLPFMVEQAWGRVIFCSSIAAATGGVIGPHYASSKSALHGIMHWIANQYCRTGVTCNAVAPALITNTEMFKAPTTAHLDLIPMGRFGQPEEIAAVVELLVTNSYMTNKV